MWGSTSLGVIDLPRLRLQRGCASTFMNCSLPRGRLSSLTPGTAITLDYNPVEMRPHWSTTRQR